MWYRVTVYLSSSDIDITLSRCLLTLIGITDLLVRLRRCTNVKHLNNIINRVCGNGSLPVKILKHQQQSVNVHRVCGNLLHMRRNIMRINNIPSWLWCQLFISCYFSRPSVTPRIARMGKAKYFIFTDTRRFGYVHKIQIAKVERG